MSAIPWTTAADLAARGLDPLTPMYMTPEQVADLVDRARANTEPFRIEVGRITRERHERYRASRGRR